MKLPCRNLSKTEIRTCPRKRYHRLEAKLVSFGRKINFWKINYLSKRNFLWEKKLSFGTETVTRKNHILEEKFSLDRETISRKENYLVEEKLFVEEYNSYNSYNWYTYVYLTWGCRRSGSNAPAAAGRSTSTSPAGRSPCQHLRPRQY